ncbi:MAG TPA: mechanosensitive ion channel [Anaerolineae bacterium]|nr:mechanosensitive ion channel [Anaerolineae bacterium]
MTFLGYQSEEWLDIGFSLLIVLGVVAVGRWLINLIFNRLLKREVDSRDLTLRSVLLDGLHISVYLLVVVVALDAAIRRLDFISQVWGDTLDDLFFVLYLCVGFTALWRLTTRLSDWYANVVAPRTEIVLDEQLMPFIRRVAMIILVLIGLIILLGHFDVDVSALITTLGVGSLAIALAAQAALADTISGFIIMIDRPFRIGDRIEIQDLGTWGDVVDIGLRSSRIRTRDNRMVIVPNSVISKSLIVNYTYPTTQYRIEVHIGVDYGSDIELVRKTMIHAVKGVEGVLPDRKVEALFLEFGESALIFRLRWWIESYIDTRRMFDRVNTAVYLALKEAGIEIPNRQVDVHHKIDAERTAQLLREVRTAS